MNECTKGDERNKAEYIKGERGSGKRRHAETLLGDEKKKGE